MTLAGSRQQVAVLHMLVICCLQFQWFMRVNAVEETCDVNSVRELSKNQRLGGWRANNSTAGQIVAEHAVKNLRSSGTNTEQIVKHHHVIEAFSQVVQGTNYCVYFSASGNCDRYHCKSYECTAKGHMSLTSRDDNIDVTGVQCTEQDACDIERIAGLAQKSMPGGWFATSGDDDKVHKLHQTASAIATVEPGEVIESYRQVVAGFKYCIRFRSKGAANCAEKCQPVTCIAGGFAPLPHETTNVDSLVRVGVDCQPDRPALLSAYSSAARLMANGAIATLLLSCLLVHLF